MISQLASKHADKCRFLLDVPPPLSGSAPDRKRNQYTTCERTPFVYDSKRKRI